MNLTDKEKKQLRLARSLSPIKYYKQLQKPTNVSLIDWDIIDKEIANTAIFGGQFIFHDSAIYPQVLLHTTCPPPVLVAKGNVALLNKKCVSIVGSRRASLQAIKMSEMLAKEISLKGQVIVSGLAVGIDTAAHKSAVQTIGVIGCGIDQYYPAENQLLQNELAQTQLIITEYPFNYPVKRESFPARNRIISGLSWATIIVEANLQSGSMITAKHALAQTREVFAVPGHPLDSRSAGCNRLIQQGAGLVQTADDVLLDIKSINLHQEDIFNYVDNNFEEIQNEIESKDVEANILTLLTTTPLFTDQIARHLDISTSIVRSALVDLEAEGKIHIDSAFRVFIV